MRRLNSALLCAFTFLLATGCGRNTNAEVANTDDAKTVRLVHTRRLVAEDRTELIRLVGSVEPVHDVTVSAEVMGTIEARLQGVGSEVVKGDRLYEIDDTRLRLAVTGAHAELLRLKATLEQQRRNLTRAENLYRDKVASEDAIENARTAVSMAEAAVLAQESAFEQLRRDLADTRVSSPINGHVVEYFVDVGELVSPGTQLMRIVDTSRVKLQTRINEVDIAKVRTGQTLEVRVDAYPDRNLAATITAIAAQADRATRTFPVEAEMDNPKEQPLLAGMVARLMIPGQTYNGVILLPQDMIVERAGHRLAFVVQPDGTVQEREVAFGPLFGPEVVIAEGLHPEDEVVVRGQFALNDGDPVQVVESS